MNRNPERAWHFGNVFELLGELIQTFFFIHLSNLL